LETYISDKKVKKITFMDLNRPNFNLPVS